MRVDMANETMLFQLHGLDFLLLNPILTMQSQKIML